MRGTEEARLRGVNGQECLGNRDTCEDGAGVTGGQGGGGNRTEKGEAAHDELITVASRRPCVPSTFHADDPSFHLKTQKPVQQGGLGDGSAGQAIRPDKYRHLPDLIC